MELRQLRYFLSIVEHGSFGRASEHLFIAQSALSAQIKKLEEELGCHLLIRGAHGVAVSPAGERLTQHARLILSQVAIAVREVQQVPSSDVRGTVRIGFTSTVGRLLIWPLLEAVGAHLPNLSLHVIEALTTDLERMVKNAEIDLAVIFRLTNEAEPDKETVLREERMYLVSPPSTVFKKEDFEAVPVDSSDLGAFEFILPSSRLTLRNLIEQEARMRNVCLRVKYEVDSLPQTLALINRTGCHSVMLLSTFYKEWLEGHVWVREITTTNIRPKTIMTWNPRNLSDAARAVSAQVIATIETLRVDGRWPLRTR